jgi:NADH-quinone oxidoreductase subunit N
MIANLTSIPGGPVDPGGDLGSLARALTPEALAALGAPLALAAGVVLLLACELWPVTARVRPALVGAALAAAAWCSWRLVAEPLPRGGLVFEGTFAAGPALGLWSLAFVAAAALAWAFSAGYYRRDASAPFKGEHDLLLLSTPVGMILMAGARDLLVFFVGLELLSIPLYALAAFRRARATSVEAGLKYFLLGAFASALYLYGAALLYASSGTLAMAELAARFGAGSAPALGQAGAALVAAALFFKISVFPFHVWVPDVYQGSPTPVTALMSAGTKAAAFAFLLRTCALLPASAAWSVAVLALITMAVGNLAALVQEDAKRMLAYSSIAHAGNVVLAAAALLAGDPRSSAAIEGAAIYYLAAYAFTACGAFGILAWLEAADGEGATRIEALDGLAQRRPWSAALLALFLLSLGGMPLTGGFLGKWLVFGALVERDMMPAAVVGVLLSVVAFAYYLRLIVAMTMKPARAAAPRPGDEWELGPLVAGAVCAAGVLLLGVVPGWLMETIERLG